MVAQNGPSLVYTPEYGPVQQINRLKSSHTFDGIGTGSNLKSIFYQNKQLPPMFFFITATTHVQMFFRLFLESIFNAYLLIYWLYYIIFLCISLGHMGIQVDSTGPRPGPNYEQV